nr:hypothetical protein [Bifidobacterium indicum]
MRHVKTGHQTGKHGTGYVGAKIKATTPIIVVYAGQTRQLVLGGEPSAVEHDALDITTKLSKSLILSGPYPIATMSLNLPFQYLRELTFLLRRTRSAFLPNRPIKVSAQKESRSPSLVVRSENIV